MSTVKQEAEHILEKYRLLLELWRRERALGRQEFLGFAITTAILALVSLSGAWWSALFGLVIAVVWFVLAARTLAQQNHLYGEMEALSGQRNDEPLFHLHRVDQVEIQVPILGKAASWAQAASRYLLLGTPAFFVIAWILGFIILLVT
jgi:hypothetical protein